MDIRDNKENFINRENMARFIDHTLLKPEAAGADIRRLCQEAVEYGFASVCINPVYVPQASEILAGSNVKVCTVVGFPLGSSASEAKAGEARLAVAQGAGEVDMVMWVGALKEMALDLVEKDIAGVVKSVREVNPDVLVKVILETCLLTDTEKVTACRIAEAAGADFVKTSTGFSTGGAVVADISLMRSSVSPHIGIKASGGIRTGAQMLEFIRVGATRIGTSSGIAIIKELSGIDSQRNK